MGFYVVDRAESAQRFDLRADELVHGGRRERQLAPAKILAVGEAWMRADGNAVFLRQRDRGLHRCRVTGVGAAGDVGRSDERHQFGVVAGAFAEVAVEVDAHSFIGRHAERMRSIAVLLPAGKPPVLRNR